MFNRKATLVIEDKFMSHTSLTKLLAIQNQYNISYVIKERPVDWMCWVEVSSATKN